MNFRLNSVFWPASLWVFLVATALAFTIAALVAGVRFARELHLLGAAAASSRTAQIVLASDMRGRPDPHERLREMTIEARPFNELARFSARIAHEQGVDLVQLQSEAINTAPTHLSQVRIRLQVQGDYAGTKSFLISLLSNFPGLALEHLTIRHGSQAGSPGSSMQGSLRANDESTIELIQYSLPRPAGA